jgi:hypothetical protein
LRETVTQNERRDLVAQADVAAAGEVAEAEELAKVVPAALDDRQLEVAGRGNDGLATGRDADIG